MRSMMWVNAIARSKCCQIAEGVETREDFDWLKQSGYQLFQGYLFGKPSAVPKR